MSRCSAPCCAATDAPRAIPSATTNAKQPLMLTVLSSGPDPVSRPGSRSLALSEFGRDGQRYFAGRRPFCAACERGPEAELAHFVRTVTECRDEYTAHPVLRRPEHRLVDTRTWDRLTGFAVI